MACHYNPADRTDRESYIRLQTLYNQSFGADSWDTGAVVASAPGRLEVAGNHVDHQGGRVISAAIAERTEGYAKQNGTNVVSVAMEGFGREVIDLSEKDWACPRPGEEGTSGALVRGMLAMYARAGGAVRGFNMVTHSAVPAGCGLSSSAAFEVMMGATLRALFDKDNPRTPGTIDLDPVTIALEAVSVEQTFFGKPCGAQDQMACACGGVSLLDFSTDPPGVKAVTVDTEAAGYGVILIDSHQDHSLYQDEFAAIPEEMNEVASLLGVRRLGDTTASALLEHFSEIRIQLGDRPALRALHYYDEVARVDRQYAALNRGDFSQFLVNVRLSGMSSAQYLQNVSPQGNGVQLRQPAMVIQGLCAHMLGQEGAWRIHGGGFGGSVLAFVPLSCIDRFVDSMNEILGYEACRRMVIGCGGVCAERLS